MQVQCDISGYRTAFGLLLHISDLTAALQSATVFLKIHLVKAYNWIPKDEGDVSEVATITSFELYTYRFEKCYANFPEVHLWRFRRLNFVYKYVDDCMIASADRKSHVHNLNRVFKRLQKYGINVNIQKF